MRFSALMPIHRGTSRGKLEECFQSLSKQSMPAEEIVILFDGPVSCGVDTCVSSFKTTLPLRLVRFENNRGLGPVLREGVIICKHNLVARIDSDDRCIEDRFELQLRHLRDNESISVVGGGLREWYPTGKGYKSMIRNGPLDPVEITSSARNRNPMNHQTVMFLRSAVLDCGNYEDLPMFEDYLLWAKMINRGYLLANLPDVLVETEVDLNYFKRRGSSAYVMKEYNAAVKMLDIGFFTHYDALKFLLTRFPIRLLPTSVRKLIYQYMIRGK